MLKAVQVRADRSGRLNILIVTQYFWPENFRINDLASDLKRKGHSVTVLTGIPNYPDGRFYEGYGIFKKREENFNGVRVVRVPLVSRGGSKGFRLALNYFSFAFCASLIGPFYCRDRYGAILVFEPSPITVCLPAIVLKKIKKSPVFFWILDLWPESLSATGAVSSAFVLKVVGRLVRFIYSQCDRILVSSKGFISQVSGMGFPSEDIRYFPNWTEEIYWQAPDKDKLNGLKALPDGFKVVFAGNIGAAQSFGTILDAAQRLKGTPDIQWLIAGDGRMSGWVRDQIRLRNLENCVHMHGRHPPETIISLFSAADALLVTLKRDPAFALTVPGKIQSYLACGKPIIASLDGEGGRLIEEAGAGISCPAEDPAALVAAVLALRGMTPEVRAEMGERGRKFCESNFARFSLLNKLEGWLTEFPKKL